MSSAVQSRRPRPSPRRGAPPPDPVTPADLAVLRDPTLPSGYATVYPHKRTSWRVIPYRHHKIGCHPSPRDGAAASVRWWRARFGPNWAAAFRARRRPPWAAVACGPDGVRLVVWVLGRPVSLGGVFADRAAAKAYLDAHLAERFGADGWRVVRREGVTP